MHVYLGFNRVIKEKGTGYAAFWCWATTGASCGAMDVGHVSQCVTGSAGSPILSREGVVEIKIPSETLMW